METNEAAKQPHITESGSAEHTKSATEISNEPASAATSSSQDKMIQLISSTGPRSLGVALGVLYTIGFLVLNTHLNKYAIFDFDISNARYLIAGSVYAFYLVMFYLLGGRAILFGKSWLNDRIAFLHTKGAKESWALLAFIHSLIHTAFFLCLSAAIFSSVAFADSGTFWFYAFLSFAFLIDFTLDITNLDSRYPKFYLIFEIFMKVPAIYIFFVMSKTNKPSIVFATYLVIAMYLNIVLDHFERYRLTTDRVVFSTVYAVIFFLISAVTFGALIYGDVSRKIGGGIYVDAAVGLTSGYDTLLGKNIDTGTGIKTKIIYTTDKYIFLEIHDQVVRVPESEVMWLRLEKMPSTTNPTMVFWKTTPWQ